MSGRYVLGFVCVVVLAGGISAAAQQQAPTPKIRRAPAVPTKTLEGQDSFQAYCAVCHGKDAKGDGPAAKNLTKMPADLTTITARHGGKFPTKDVEEMIIGENRPSIHGTSDMPMWGPIFRNMDGDRDVATLRLKNLIGYLESLQAK